MTSSGKLRRRVSCAPSRNAQLGTLNVELHESYFFDRVLVHEGVERRGFHGDCLRETAFVVIDDGADALIVGVGGGDAHGQLCRRVGEGNGPRMRDCLKVVASNVCDEAIKRGRKWFEGVNAPGRAGEGGEMERHFPEVCTDVEDGHAGADAGLEEEVEFVVVIAVDEDVAVEVKVVGEEQFMAPAVAGPGEVFSGARVRAVAENVVKPAGRTPPKGRPRAMSE